MDWLLYDNDLRHERVNDLQNTKQLIVNNAKVFMRENVCKNPNFIKILISLHLLKKMEINPKPHLFL